MSIICICKASEDPLSLFSAQHACMHSKEARVAQSELCLTTGWTTGVRSSTEAEEFSSSLCVQTSYGGHSASCTMGTGGKARPGRDADHSPPSSDEVRNE
jgi:hypothetical protein